jgi:hypothetical protein
LRGFFVRFGEHRAAHPVENVDLAHKPVGERQPEHAVPCDAHGGDIESQSNHRRRIDLRSLSPDRERRQSSSNSAWRPVRYAFMADARSHPTGAWTDDEIEREERATRARLARDREAGAAKNVRAAAALGRFANRVADAAASSRRDGSARS